MRCALPARMPVTAKSRDAARLNGERLRSCCAPSGAAATSPRTASTCAARSQRAPVLILARAMSAFVVDVMNAPSVAHAAATLAGRLSIRPQVRRTPASPPGGTRRRATGPGPGGPAILTSETDLQPGGDVPGAGQHV